MHLTSHITRSNGYAPYIAYYRSNGYDQRFRKLKPKPKLNPPNAHRSQIKICENRQTQNVQFRLMPNAFRIPKPIQKSSKRVWVFRNTGANAFAKNQMRLAYEDKRDLYCTPPPHPPNEETNFLNYFTPGFHITIIRTPMEVKFVFFKYLGFLIKQFLSDCFLSWYFTSYPPSPPPPRSPIYKNIHVLIMWPIYIYENKCCSHSSSSVTYIYSISSVMRCLAPRLWYPGSFADLSWLGDTFAVARNQ